MPKVLVATEKPFAPKAVQEIRDILTEAGYELALLEKYTEKKDLLDAVADIDGLIIRSDIVDSSVLEAAKNLKIVVRAGAGYDNIDLVAATAKGVVAMNTPGQNSNAVAELALGMMIYIARGQFNGKAGTELKNKTLGIHAYGNVGKLVAKIAKGFGMQVFAFDPFVGSATIEADGVIAVKSQEELYSKCRYISLHIPATGETKGSIDFELLSKMPDGAVLVNTARKEVVNEEGLKKMFAERKDFCYATDVAPDCTDELVQYETRYFATPKKMGAQTAEANINAGIAAAQQIVAYINKGDTTFQVNK
ncbi:MAG: NAD(P)-dependent oxidoreductase [Bacteroidales bacterium]|nr:NAD(P)-dependent oxidoreductase [Bacteroidales bacterium]